MHELAARAVLPAADPAARGAGPRRQRVRARLRPDARAARRTPAIAHDASSGRRTAAPGAPARSRAMGSRLRALRAWAGAAGGSTSRSRTPRTSFRWLPAPAGCRRRTPYDYEFARAQHTLGSPRGDRGSSSRRRSRRSGSTGSGATRAKVRRYPGLKEEYYLAGLHADAACSTGSASIRPRARRRAHAARGLALPPAREPALRRRARAARHATPRCRPSCHRARADQREALRDGSACRRSSLPSTRSTPRALIALATLVVSAGRDDELARQSRSGTPVWTTFAGTDGCGRRGPDRDGRCAELTAADAARARGRGTAARRSRSADPELMSTCCCRRSS